MSFARIATVAILIACVGSSVAAPLYFQNFAGDAWKTNFLRSQNPKYNGELVGEIPPGLDSEALKVTEKAKYYGYSALLNEPVDPANGLVLQFELKLTSPITCGGAYLKYLTASAELTADGLVEDTPYTVMFGPDKCGLTNKVHLIIRHKAPNGEIEEKHLESPPEMLVDGMSHIYTAVLDPTDNSFTIKIDGILKKTGSIFEEFSPPFNPPKKIDDPEAFKPEDWVDVARIPDPDATKPDDWDDDAPMEIPDMESSMPEGWLVNEPESIYDVDAEEPMDWDEEEDGEWEAPMIPNPKCSIGCGEWQRPMIPNPDYKGKWNPPMIANPEYKGAWKPPKIDNPDYYEDPEPLRNIGKIGAVAIEIWTMDNDYYFNNILIDQDPAVAVEYLETYWRPKLEIEKKFYKTQEKKMEEDVDDDEEGIVVKFIRDSIENLMELPGFSSLSGPLSPVLDIINENDNAAIATAAVLVGTVLFILIQMIPRGGKAAQVPKKPVSNKKTDKSEDNDKDESSSEAEVAGDDDDDDKKTTRRRVRREA